MSIVSIETGPRSIAAGYNHSIHRGGIDSIPIDQIPIADVDIAVLFNQESNIDPEKGLGLWSKFKRWLGAEVAHSDLGSASGIYETRVGEPPVKNPRYSRRIEIIRWSVPPPREFMLLQSFN